MAMKIIKFTLSMLWLTALLLSAETAVFAQSEQNAEILSLSTEEYNSELPLCLPGVYLLTPTDCLPMGTSVLLTELAQKGITIPLKPLPAFKPDRSLVELDIRFAKLNLLPGEQAAFYPNLESAVSGLGAYRYIGPGKHLYLAFKQQANVGGGNFIQVETNEWVRASPTSYSTYQGLQFFRSPTNDFGWIIERTNPYPEPNYQSKQTGEIFERETVVQVYDVVEVSNTRWYMIGLGKWIPQRYISVVDSSYTTPEGVDNGRWIGINLEQQYVAVYENNQLIFATLAATGMEPYFTQPGLFPIYEMKETETMTGSFEADKSDYYYFDQVPWTMYYDQNRALHGAYWRALFGYAQTHGCVNLSIGDARWIYEWADIGDWVYVWDPSDKTPTDPNFYGAGGA